MSEPAPEQLRCTQCGYSLRGHTAEDVCPECAMPVCESMAASERPRAHLAAIGLVNVLLLWFCMLQLDRGFMAISFGIPSLAYWASILAMSIRVRGKYGPREVKYANQGWIIIPIGFIIVWAILVTQMRG